MNTARRLYQYNEVEDVFSIWVLISNNNICNIQYPCCLNAWENSKFKSKVVFIVLIYTTTTVVRKSLRSQNPFCFVFNFKIVLFSGGANGFPNMRFRDASNLVPHNSPPKNLPQNKVFFYNLLIYELINGGIIITSRLIR